VTRHSAGGVTLDPVTFPHAAPNSFGLHWFVHVYMTPGFPGSGHFSSLLMHVDTLPSVPLHMIICFAARQLSRIGDASSASKVDDQLQVAGGVFASSFLAASLLSAPTLPPHPASKPRANHDASRTKGMPGRVREAWDIGLGSLPRAAALMQTPIRVIGGEFQASRVQTPAQRISRRVERNMSLLESYGLSFFGGALIGLSASIVLLTHGRAAGVSSLFGGLFLPGHDARDFRLWFVLGLVAAGIGLSTVYPGAFASAWVPPIGMIAASGLLVGFGTRLGGGCTSGHGVCGLCRLSGRSAIATMTFIGTGMLTVFIVRHIAGVSR
jgi:hypothetical protein